MPENILLLKSVNTLLDELTENSETLFIPSYQRGYRWTERQVTDLLDDLFEFSKRPIKKETDIYCLQPVVVAKSGQRWEVIDGQQRLTTIHILLSFFNSHVLRNPESIFVIEYATRPGSESFLNNIDYSRKNENIDYYHICEAHRFIVDWFSKKPNLSLIGTELYQVLLNNANIIWYEVKDGTDAIDVFTRINMGKIQLTNAELIKALFLKSNNFGNDSDKIRVKQLEIAGEWDRMEYALQDDAFWYFISNGEKQYATKIEFIFDFMAKKTDSLDDFVTFRFFNKKFEKNIPIEDLWTEVKDYFLTFEEWYNDRTFYHLVGFLISSGADIQELKKHSSAKSKSDFTEYLNVEISNLFASPIQDLAYSNKDNQEIRRVLLLFNIETMLENKDSNLRFPFDKYKIENWDLEHIHAVQSEIPETKKEQIDWLNEVLAYLKPEQAELTYEITLFLNQRPGQKELSFEAIYNKVVENYSQVGDDLDVNDISNLTLLDATTNRSYKNAVYPIKRQTILKRDQQGTFVPLCTKNVFLKYYSDDLSHMSFYGRNDRECYMTAITTALNKYYTKLQLN